MILLDGKKAREHFAGLLQEKILKLSIPSSSTAPCLAIIQIGNRPDSDAFIKAKKSFAQKIGAKEIHIQLPEIVTQSEVVDVIKKSNLDTNIHGIIVQLPLPAHLDSNGIIETVDPKKDVDGLTSKTLFTPATARGISQLFGFYQIDIKNKKITVVGRSKLVGTPIAEMCRKRGAEVTVCHKETPNIPSQTKGVDMVIVAIGQPGFIDEKYISKGQIVIDVGITRVGDKLVGDVAFDKVSSLVTMITPVPGGVGPMTVLALFENLIDAWYNQKYE